MTTHDDSKGRPVDALAVVWAIGTGVLGYGLLLGDFWAQHGASVRVATGF